MEAYRSPSFNIGSHPTDHMLVLSYLLPKVESGTNNGTSFIHGGDVVYRAHPDELSTKYPPAVSLDGKRAWYFFTPLRFKSDKDRRIVRAVPNGGGSWTAERKAMPLYKKEDKKIIAERKSLSFKSRKLRTGWLMTEFVAVDDNGKPRDLALCKVYETPRNSKNSGDKEASDAAEEKEAGDGGESTRESDEDHDKEASDAADEEEEEEEEADGGGESTRAGMAAMHNLLLGTDDEIVETSGSQVLPWLTGQHHDYASAVNNRPPSFSDSVSQAWNQPLPKHVYPSESEVLVGPGPDGSSAGADECLGVDHQMLADSNTDTAVTPSAAGKKPRRRPRQAAETAPATTVPRPVPSESEPAPISATPEKAISRSPPIAPEGYMCTQNDLEVIESIKRIPSSPGLQEVLLIHGYAVTRSNMECLFQQGTYLNSQVIDARIAMLRTQGDMTLRSGSSAFLEDSDFTNAVKWGRDETIKKRVPLYLQHDMVFLPINIQSGTSSHWYLAVLNAKKRQIQILDSLSTEFGREDLRATMSKLKEGIDLVRRDIKEHEWPDLDVDSWPQDEIFQEKMQTDGCSCGLFLMKYVEHWTGEELRHGVTQEDMTRFKDDLAAILLTSELNSRKGRPSVENDNTGSTASVEIVEGNQTLKKRKHRGETEIPEDESGLSKTTQGRKYRLISSITDRGSSPSRARTESDTRPGAAPADPTIGIKPRRSNPDSLMATPLTSGNKSPERGLEPPAAEVAEHSESELPAAPDLAFDSSIPPGGMVEENEMATFDGQAVNKIVEQLAESSRNYGVLITSLAAERDRYAAGLKTECEEHKRTKAALEAASREKEEAIAAVRAECEQEKEAIRKQCRQKLENGIVEASASMERILRARCYDDIESVLAKAL